MYKRQEQSLGKSYFLKYPNHFNTRIIVQKTLYLLTHGLSNPKISLPYRWNFYLRGPYSSGIAHMIYHMINFKDDVVDTPIELEKNFKNSLNHFHEFKGELDSIINKYKKYSKIYNADIYELLATLIYISQQIGSDKDKLFGKLKQFKPNLSKKLPLEDMHKILTKFKYI